MKKLLLIGIVLSVCFVGTASDSAYFTLADGTITSNAVISLPNVPTTLDWNSGNLITTEAIYVRGPSECQHPKLKALGDNCWGSISRHEFCPTEYRQRAYQCRECKKKIVIQQAILIESKEKTQ